MPTAAYFLVNVVPATSNNAAPRKDIFFDSDFNLTNLSALKPDYLDKLYAERADPVRDVPWEGSVWNVFYGNNPAQGSPVTRFPLPAGPVCLQFWIPDTSQSLAPASKAVGSVAAQFPVSQFPAAQKVAVVPGLTSIYRGNSNLTYRKGENNFTLQYVIINDRI